MRINSWEFCHFFSFSKEVGKGIFFFIFCFHFLNIFCKAILHFCSFPVSIPEVLDKNGRKRQFCLDRSGLNCHFIGQQLFLIALIFGFLSETWKVYWGDEIKWYDASVPPVAFICSFSLLYSNISASSSCIYAWMNPSEGSISDFSLVGKEMFWFISSSIAFCKSCREPVTQGWGL